MEMFLFFALCTIGLCHIIIDGSILEDFRMWWKNWTVSIGYPKLGGLVDCYLCCGTWCGFLMALIFVSYNPFKIVALGFAGGFLSNFAAVLLNYLEAQTMVSLNTKEADDAEEQVRTELRK
jgi:hypothetical protein